MYDDENNDGRFPDEPGRGALPALEAGRSR